MSTRTIGNAKQRNATRRKQLCIHNKNNKNNKNNNNKSKENTKSNIIRNRGGGRNKKANDHCDDDEFNPWQFIKSLPPYNFVKHLRPLEGLPPMAIFSGTSDILLVDGRRLAEKLAHDGMPRHIYREYEDMFHVWMLLPVPEN